MFSLIQKNKSRINYKAKEFGKLFKFNITLSKLSNLNENDKLNKSSIEINNKTFFIKVNNIVIFEAKKYVIFNKLILFNKYYISL